MLPDNRLYPSSFVPPYQFATEPPPLASYSQQQPVIFNGPFQIIEPGSDQYIETEPNFCLDLLPEEGLDTSGGLFLSENGIPADVLDDVFRLEDEVGVLGCGPVAEGVGMGQYEAQLVAEIERLFPDVTATTNAGGVRKRVSGTSRLAEELSRKVSAGTLIPVVSGSPCYMNVFLKGGGRLQNNLSKSEPPTERGYRCVEMIDGAGTMFKAKYYAEQMTAATTPARPSTPTPARVVSMTKFSPIVTATTTTTTPTRLPQLKNITPAMASKIESLANGTNRNVTLTPVRTPSRNSLVSSSSSPSTIVIKAPKRTIASGGSTTIPDPFFPMPMIKQEPLDDPPTPQEDPLLLNPPKINLPANPLPNKQPRKQKLVKLSQNGEVVFNDTTNVAAAAGRERKFVAKVVQAPPNNGYVPRDLSDPKKHPPRGSPTPNHPQKGLRLLKPLPSPTPQQIKSHSSRSAVATPPPKRTRYRVHMTQTQLPPQQQHRPGVSKRVPVNQTIESIEILDSSDEEDEEETTTAPESSEPEDGAVTTTPRAGGVTAHPKLPGNTESIQCPYCCRIFRSYQAVLEHSQNCADASLFRQISKQKQHQQHRTQGQSLLKGNNYQAATPSSSSKKNRPSSTPMATTSKRSERLSIEILPSAFNIDNLLLCQACQKSFRTVEHLEQHQRIHQKPVVCEFCKKKFYETPPPKHVCQEKKRSMKLERASRSR